MTDGLTEKDRSGLRAVLEASPKVRRAVLFGSRAMGTFRGSSDVDLALEGDDLGLTDLAAIKAKIAELNLPVEVDLIVRAKIKNPELEKHIKTHGREWHRNGACEGAVISDDVMGEIPEHWEFTTLGEVCRRGGGNIQTGPFGSQLHASDYVPVGIPSVMPTNIGENRIVEDGIVRISEDDANRLRQHRLRPGDIVYSRRGDVEKRALVREREQGWLCGTGCLKVRLGSGVVEPLFASFFLGHPSIKAWIVRHAVGATMPNLNTSIMSAVPFALPPLAEQKAIAAVLGALDDKIELNRRMNATLEAMSRALFQSWFVDFDPVRAKLDGRRPGGLDSATAALFPAAFQNSPIGPVPKGWKIERFDAHITADRGLSYKGESLREDRSGLPMHNLNSIYEGGGYKHEGLKYYAGDYREKHLLNPGDMIVTNTEQGFDHLLIGHAAIVPRCYGPKGIYSHHIYRVRHKPTSPFSPHYLVELFNNRRWHYWISGFSNGTTVNMLPMDALAMPMLVVPPVELVKKFSALAEAAHSQIEDNKEQSRTLAIVRDALLPRLLSGELAASGQHGTG